MKCGSDRQLNSPRGKQFWERPIIFTRSPQGKRILQAAHLWLEFRVSAVHGDAWLGAGFACVGLGILKKLSIRSGI
jgi:hypothetical protein